MKVLFIGDVFGQAGRDLLRDYLPKLVETKKIDFTIANIENITNGKGISPSHYQFACQSGIDVCTGGNHSFDKKEIFPYLNDEPFLIRPANYPEELPGKGFCTYSNSQGQKITVINLLGRIFIDPVDCPFRKVNSILEKLGPENGPFIIDFHAETTAEKNAMAHYLDGRASLVVGTHTHIPTADHRILPGGTATITDLGMTGPYDSVIGVKKEIIVERFWLRRGQRFQPAETDPWLCGVIAEIDDKDFSAKKIEQVIIKRNQKETHP